MILITGAGGFIGSCVASSLYDSSELLLVDDFNQQKKLQQVKSFPKALQINRDILFDFLKTSEIKLEYVIHLGARTDTIEQDEAIFNILNVDYSKAIWNYCSEQRIPLIYASSAATYGAKESDFIDDHHLIQELKPLNQYGYSKHNFDLWALKQSHHPPQWFGLKFFNVYGPNEYNKGRMASVIFHCYHQIKSTGKMKLFKSDRDEIKHGHQARDFIYVKDVLSIIQFLKLQNPTSGIYNIGTSTARTFLDLATATFQALDLKPNIEFIETPLDLKDRYQYFTEANMRKLAEAGYSKKFYTLEDGIKDYVVNYLAKTLSL